MLPGTLQAVRLHFAYDPLLSPLVMVSILAVTYILLYSKTTVFDLVNGKTGYEISAARAKSNFLRNARKILSDRLNKVPGKPFRVLADIGEVTILPPDYAHEIRNDERFSFTKAAYKVLAVAKQAVPLTF